ncbi:MAG: arsenate reductase [Sphingomonadales bacterium]
MIDVYGIRNCDTVKKARDWLEAEGIEYRFHDFKLEGLDAKTAAGWIAALGQDVVINKRGTTWRKLTPAQQAIGGDADAAALIASQPSLVKRPVFDTGKALFVGFGDQQRQALKSL